MYIVPAYLFQSVSSKADSRRSITCLNERETVFLVEEPSQMYILKRYETGVTGGAKLNEQVEKYLQRKGYESVAKVLQVVEPHHSSEDECGSAWLKMQYVEGEPRYNWMSYIPVEAQLLESGRQLALMHQASILSGDDFKTDVYDLLNANCPNLNAEYLRSGFEAALAQVRAYAEESDLDFNSSSNSNSNSNSVSVERVSGSFVYRFSSSPPDYGKVTIEDPSDLFAVSVLVHGDYHPGNIIYSGDQVKAVIDFDYAHINCPAYDLAYGLFMFCVANKTGPCSGFGNDELDLATLFLSGYYDGLGLGKPDVTAICKLLEPYIALASLHTMIWSASNLASQNRSAADYEATQFQVACFCFQFLLSIAKANRG